MSPLAYLRVWLASIRYSVMRTLMFRFDFFLWVIVDTLWMAVNLVTVEVIYGHTESIAGWNKHEMILLVGTAMLTMRLFMAFFLTNLFSIDRNIREGTFDFYLAQPGHPLFMISTRKIDLDGIFNTVIAIGIIVYAVRELGLAISLPGVLTYALLVLCGLVIHYSTVVMIVSLGFWIVRVSGIENGYWGIFDLSRLPRRALRGVMEVVFVYCVPAVVVSNFPAETLLHGPQLWQIGWLVGAAALWFLLATGIFSVGLRRYTSASS